MKYNMYKFWIVLKNECDKVILTNNDFENAKQIKRIQILFEKMSEIFLSEFDVKDLARMYTDFNQNKTGSTYTEVFKNFKNYVYCVSDRMNINRWLHAKMLINMAFDLAYMNVDAKEWYNKCFKWTEDSNIGILEEEVNKWFNENFDNLYNTLEED